MTENQLEALEEYLNAREDLLKYELRPSLDVKVHNELREKAKVAFFKLKGIVYNETVGR